MDSVERNILASQGCLGKWQSSLLSLADRNLAEGNYSSAVEWVRKARDLPREVPRDSVDPTKYRALAGLSSSGGNCRGIRYSAITENS
jgi:hypothetical protein